MNRWRIGMVCEDCHTGFVSDDVPPFSDEDSDGMIASGFLGLAAAMAPYPADAARMVAFVQEHRGHAYTPALTKALDEH
jgi:hypothetical protein